MDKIAMLSILFVTVALPAALARGANPRRSLKRMIVLLLAFNALYAGYVGWIHTTYYVPPAWPWGH